MARIVVTNEVSVYEIDGKDVGVGSFSDPPPKLLVKSHHGKFGKLVVLQWGDGPKITVAARDIQDAVKNATNVGEF